MKRFSLVCMLLVVVVPLYAQSTLLPESFDVQGHRGARGLKPENTLPAFEIALDLRVSTLEMDLHFTADDRVVVWHDPEINMDRCRLPEDNTIELPQSSSLIFGSNSLQIRQLTLEQVQAFICDGLDNERFPQQVVLLHQAWLPLAHQRLQRFVRGQCHAFFGQRHRQF